MADSHDIVRPQLLALYAEAWTEFQAKLSGREAAREALNEKVWELDLGQSSSINVDDLKLAIGVLATAGT